MQEAAVLQLADWESFYVIVGSAAAALIGLQFVVITLTAGRSNNSRTIATFGTPTVFHFGVAFFLAVLLSAPWQDLAPVAVFVGLTGLVGWGYAFIVFRRARQSAEYAPVMEDWIFHVILPFLGYTVLIVSAIFLPSSPDLALFGAATVAVLLVFIGIHNAWDAITYIATEILPEDARRDEEKKLDD